MFFMCISIPAKILKKSGETGTVEILGKQKQVNFLLLPEAKEEDYVILHSEFPVRIISKEEAKRILDGISNYENNDTA